jgi:hypothetical protein
MSDLRSDLEFGHFQAGHAFSLPSGIRLRLVHPSVARTWRLAIRAIKWAWPISLDFCSRMLYPTLDGS